MEEKYDYAGFWIRMGATIIDSIFILIVIVPILWLVYGPEYFENPEMQGNYIDMLLTDLMPAVAAILFWIYKSATPGKMILKLEIVDAKTGGKPSTRQFLGRYVSYFISSIPLGLGMWWIGWDKHKRGWHNMLAGTLVIRKS